MTGDTWRLRRTPGRRPIPSGNTPTREINKPLENKITLVTGFSRGIGAAVAVRLAADGAAVIVNYVASPARADPVVKEIRKAGGEAEAVAADLSNGDGVKSLIGAVDTAFTGRSRRGERS